MANQDLVPASREYFRIGDISYKRSNTEALLRKVGAAINYINDRFYHVRDFSMYGFFFANSFNNYLQKYHIPYKCEVIAWTMTVGHTVNTGNNSINFKVYDDTGAFIGNLFGTAPIVNQNAVTQATVGKDVDAVDIIQNTASGYNVGSLSISTLEKNYSMVPFIVSNAVGSFNISVSLSMAPLE
jgi:hypothetical protein